MHNPEHTIRERLDRLIKSLPERLFEFCCFNCGEYYTTTSHDTTRAYRHCPSCKSLVVP